MRALVIVLVLAAGPGLAQDTSRQIGLDAWDRIFSVTSHPRCTNCHVGEGGQPMWNALGYGENRTHGMNVRADQSRIGAESIPCRTCHISAENRNATPHAAPQIDDAWRLPPIELAWLGKSSAEVCAQLRNPETNDDNTIAELAEHLRNSAFVSWGFNPGAGREAPQTSLAMMVDDVLAWGAAGTPCAQDQ
ncbi:hypothetical protein C1J03_17650 [Sulfitobacter sp. SK012]|uniref:hypothetical protein n=1 Tax=Sulfitobacter sp. SK012 TaxID=1389005 RepID=UPI000E0BE4C6|nr:hypothetical protein [Sulfitobacter sp. SK012]AXI47670.1 hypothetical protein C1J03_17650 [Sulfitobacter sp. SK012]